MDNRRDILKSEITELQLRLGIKVIVTRNLKSIEDCRKALVEITKHYASISQGKLVNPGLDTEVDILRKKVKVLQEEKAELEKTNNVDAAAYLGTVIAKKAIEKGINTVVFDRGGFIYQGKIKALADAAREAGLEF